MLWTLNVLIWEVINVLHVLLFLEGYERWRLWTEEVVVALEVLICHPCSAMLKFKRHVTWKSSVIGKIFKTLPQSPQPNTFMHRQIDLEVYFIHPGLC